MFKAHCSFYSSEVRLEILEFCHGVVVLFAVKLRMAAAFVICGRIGNGRFVKD
jgi:lipid-binding SYLF domain-containing protein